MSQVTFDSTDNPDIDSSRQEAEAQSLAVGEKIINEQKEAEAELYEKVRKDAESQIRYAGKFRSAEDLEKAYVELEKKLGQPKEEPAEEVETTDEPEAPEPTEGEEEEKETEESKPQAPEVSRLNPEEELQLLTSVGGPEFYNQALKWAAENLSQEEIDAYDGILGTGDRGAVAFAVKSLVQQFKANGDYDGAPVSGKAVKGQGTKPFRSQAELARAINNPKYREDPAYRLDVERRLAASGNLL
jgi:hypothetical protein